MTAHETELLKTLRGSDDKKAYALYKQMNAESAQSNIYYALFDEFVKLASGKNSFIRTRGFSLCCTQARWDYDGKLAAALPALISQLPSEKPTAVRQCLKALHEVVLYRSELSDMIADRVACIEPERFGESMVPLIKKDLKELQKMIKG